MHSNKRIGLIFAVLTVVATLVMALLVYFDTSNEHRAVKLAAAEQKSRAVGSDRTLARVDEVESQWTPDDDYVASSTYSHYATCTVTKVEDGNKFFCVDQSNGERLKMSLFGIAAPSLNQAYGEQAKQYLSNRLLNKKIYYSQMFIDDWQRFSAIVYYDNHNINLEMLAQGNAHVDTRYNSRPIYQVAQNYASSNFIGLWNQHNWDHKRPPVKPWLYTPQPK